jgi:HlyD family secretion protein
VKKKIVTGAFLLVLVLIGVYLVKFGLASSAAVKYDFTTITRGDIENTISASGTLTPITSVEVGTQVSGTIDSVFVDFNDSVREGEILVVLDTTLLKSSVLDAESNVERAEAQVEGAEADYNRNKALFDRKLISDEAFLPFQINLKSQRATLKSAAVALEKAQRNLQYAVVRSPINGIVISKNVEAGQTVAASLSSPTLFIIAKDFSHMEILAAVDESDIGQIKEGQDVRFEVATYADKKFTGKVKQVRLQPQTISNVVTYTVVVEAKNEDNLLLPGMTASMDFIADKRTNVLLVSNKALRFQPSDKELNAFKERQQQRLTATNKERSRFGGDSTTAGAPLGGSRPGSSREGRSRDAGRVWYLDSLGQLAAAPLRPGLSDGSNTEIVASRVLKENMQVIIGTQGENGVAKVQTSTATSRGGFSPRGPGF